MLDTLRKTLALLDQHEKRRGSLIMLMILIMAIFEVVGVASIMPFLAVLGNPEIIRTNSNLALLYDYFGMQSTDEFLFWLGVAAFILVILSAVFRIITHYHMNRFIEMRRHSLGQRLLERYLAQPYAFFLDRHTADMSKSILSEVDQVVSNVFKPGVIATAYSVVSLAVITLIIAVNPIVAIVVAVVIGGLYLLIFKSVSGRLVRIGQERAKANQERFTHAGEALSGIKDIKLLGRESVYLSRYRRGSMVYAMHQATNQTLSEVPRYLIEAIAFGSVIALSVLLMVASDNIGEVLPILGLYAFAGYKLLPAMQQVYSGASKLRFGSAAVHDLHKDLCGPLPPTRCNRDIDAPLVPVNQIALSSVCFSYPNASRFALRNINLTIPVGSVVGIVGGTGAGKTTLVDLFLGLLSPSAGELIVDDDVISNSNLNRWQRALGYVPQDIFLCDASIAENIALGVPRHQIDHDQVIECAKMAQIHTFVIDELPDGYCSGIGERGVRLSGGQRQRLGIARALYRDPSVLVFDEATSALDTVTEESVMECISEFARKKTIILIAHRLSTVRRCDSIFLLEQGHIIAQGTFNELRSESEAFRKMSDGR